ncbi:MAG TPA: hypothetical protein DDY13_09585 [Cytophagales bacterium]|nr:hypothetical protein [Cytophagales bacterium]
MEVEGAVNITSNTSLTTKNLKMILEGVGKIDLDLKVEKLIVEIEGVGNIKLRGKCNYHKVTFEGLGNYDARDLLCRNAMVEASGLGKVRVHASEKFIGSTEGIGTIIYYGDPKYQEINSEGLGNIKSGNY